VSAPEAARFFLALSDPTRLALLTVLRDGERPVGDLVDTLGCPQPKVSRHLKVLKDARLVRDRRDGRNVYYALTAPRTWPPDARTWIERLDAGLTPRPAAGERAAPGPVAPHRAASEPATHRVPSEPAPAQPAAEMEDFLL
jgi:DNA-binding transcriptional ArsR family regulator